MKAKQAYKIFVLCVFALLLASSCSSILDKKINRTTIEGDALKLIKEERTMDSSKIKVLINLVSMAISEDYFKNVLDFKLKRDSVETNLKTKYTHEVIDLMFNYFNQKNVTYKKLFVEIDSLNAINERYQKKLLPIYAKADTICRNIQEGMDLRDSFINQEINRLTQKVEFQVVSINKNEGFQKIIELDISLTNKLTNDFNRFNGTIIFFDSKRNKIGDYNFSVDQGFENYKTHQIIIDEKDELFKLLENQNLDHLTYGFKVFQIDDDWYLNNFDYYFQDGKNSYYKSPAIFDSTYFCAYLQNDSFEFMGSKTIKDTINQVLDEKIKEIKQNTPIMFQYITCFNSFLFEPVKYYDMRNSFLELTSKYTY